MLANTPMVATIERQQQKGEANHPKTTDPDPLGHHRHINKTPIPRLPLLLPPPHEVSSLRKGSFEFEEWRGQNKNKGEKKRRKMERNERKKETSNKYKRYYSKKDRIKYNKKLYKLATVTSYM